MAINGLVLQQAGQGDSYILPAFNSDRITERLDHLEAVKAAKAAAEAKAKKERDTRLDELMKWTPEQAWYPHTEQHQQKVKDVYNYMTDLRKQGDEPSPEQLNTLNQKKWDAETVAKKSQDIKALYPQLRQDINASDKYTNKEYLHSKLNDEVFGTDGKKDLNQIDFNNLGNLGADPKAFKAQEWSKDFAASLPESIDTMIGTMNVAGGDLITDKEVKSKFFDLDANGNVRYQDGKPVIKISDETTNLALQEPRFNAYVQEQLAKPENKYKTARDIVRDELAPYASREEKINLQKGYSDKDKETDAATITHEFGTTFHHNVGTSEKKAVAEGYTPHAIRIGGEKADKPILINATHIYDPNTNKPVKDAQGENLVGDRPVTITRLVYLPFDKNTGRFKALSKDKLKAYGDNIDYRWVAEGIDNSPKGGKPSSKPIFIPYDEASIDLKEKLGVDLDKRTPSEYSNEELQQFVKKNYPQYTTDQKIAKFKELRNLK